MRFLDINSPFLTGETLATSFRDICIDEWSNHDLDEEFFMDLVRHVVGKRADYPPHNDGLLKSVIDLARLAAQSGVDNAYHNPLHTAQVTMMTALFARQVGIKGKAYLEMIAAAFGHDLWHPGYGNPPSNPIQNEGHSSHIVYSVMEKNQAPLDSKEMVRAMIISTSPNGPHRYLKHNCHGEGWHHHQGILVGDSAKINRAKILCDADVFLSAGVDMAACHMASEKLTVEAKSAGQGIDFKSPQSRLYFLNNIVGEDGFSSDIARRLANDNYHGIKQSTLLEVRKAQPKGLNPL